MPSCLPASAFILHISVNLHVAEVELNRPPCRRALRRRGLLQARAISMPPGVKHDISATEQDGPTGPSPPAWAGRCRVTFKKGRAVGGGETGRRRSKVDAGDFVMVGTNNQSSSTACTGPKIAALFSDCLELDTRAPLAAPAARRGDGVYQKTAAILVPFPLTAVTP